MVDSHKVNYQHKTVEFEPVISELLLVTRKPLPPLKSKKLPVLTGLGMA